MVDSGLRCREKSQNKSFKWEIVKERKCERTIRTCDEGNNKTKGKKNQNINDEDISWRLQSDMLYECVEHIYLTEYLQKRQEKKSPEIYENYSQSQR